MGNADEPVRNLLIAGLGSIGRRHLALVRETLPGARITVLRHPASAAQPVAGVEVVTEVERALEAGIEAAIIANPASLHLETAQPLARAGVHLLIEKPLSHSAEGIDPLIAACAENSAILQVGYCLRFDPSLRAMKKAFDDGRIGRALGFQASVGQHLVDWRSDADYRRTVSARSELGGGALLELSHEIDYARWLLGEPTSVAARLARSGELEIDVEDSADLILTFTSGIAGTVHLDMLQRPATRTVRLFGTEGTLIWDGIRHESKLLPPDGGAAEILHAAKDGTMADVYRAQFRHFLDCIAKGLPPLVGGESGQRVIYVIEAARRASREGRIVTL